MTERPPSTMRQWWVVPGPQGGEVELREVPVPTPGDGQVLVRMTAAGVNRGELIGARLLRTDCPRARPITSGIELSGIVAAVGTGVAGWAVGDRVMARGQACHAEYAVVDHRALMASPGSLSDIDAGAIPNVFVTAHDAVVTTAAVSADDTVLITAGPSGVGTAAIQIAGHLGAGVVATTRSPAKAERLTDLGADLVVDTTDPGWRSAITDRFGPVSCVVDQVGGELFPELLGALAVRGRYVTVGRTGGATSTVDLDLVARNRLRLIGVTFRTRTEAERLDCTRRFAADLLPLFDTGTLRPVVDRTFDLAELAAAHEYMGSDAQLGKILLVA